MNEEIKETLSGKKYEIEEEEEKQTKKKKIN